MTRSSQGFTLIELLVVLAIVLALAAFLTPLVGYSRHRMNRAHCEHNLRQIGSLVALYADDHHGWLPHAGGTRVAGSAMSAHRSYQVLFDEIEDLDPRVLVPAVSGRKPARAVSGRVVIEPENCGYTFVAQRTNLSDSSRIPIASNLGPRSEVAGEGHPDGILVLHLGGSVDWVPTDELGGRPYPEGLVGSTLEPPGW